MILEIVLREIVFITNETRLLDFYLYLRLFNNKIIEFHYFKHLLILNNYLLGSHIYDYPYL